MGTSSKDPVKSTEAPKEPAFPGAKKTTAVVRGKTFDLVKFDPPFKKSDHILGKPALDWLEKPDSWLGRTKLMRIPEQDTTDFEKVLYSTAAPVTIAAANGPPTEVG